METSCSGSQRNAFGAYINDLQTLTIVQRIAVFMLHQ